ncbi:GM23110 [Drosophila sechellia]|uniref:GM23110 n=1 Tax=Drosophila sechellia TaxID=7238 RepID=B4IID2_DROSE|nr:GM23110 [Drosophila sechellia]
MDASAGKAHLNINSIEFFVLWLRLVQKLKLMLKLQLPLNLELRRLQLRMLWCIFPCGRGSSLDILAIYIPHSVMQRNS